jgi:hypothetical protein
MPGDVIASFGEVAQEMYFVLEGKVDVKYWDPVLGESRYSTLEAVPHLAPYRGIISGRCAWGPQ